MVHSSYAAALIWTAVVYQLMVLSSAQNNAPGYLGCFDNSWIGGRALRGVSTFSSSLSVEWCFKYCLNINAYKYAGVEYETQCYCGNNEDYDRLGRAADSECRRYTCPGNSNQYCGGNRRIAVYQISKGVCNNAIGPPGHGSHYVTNPTHVYSNLDNSKFFGTRVQFECDTGYVIQGAETIECTQIGDIAEWSNSVPTCIGDNTQPVVTLCPENIVFPVSFQSTGTTLTWTEPIATDNSGALTTTSTHSSGDFFAANTQTTVIYNFTDAANNQAVCTFTVTINELGTIIGIAVAVIASLLVLLVIVIFRKRQHQKGESINCVNGSVNKIQADATPMSTYEIPKPHEYDVVAESTYETPSPPGAAESTYELPSPAGVAESTYELPSPAGVAESTYETPSPAGAVNPNPKESVVMSAYEIPRPPTNQNHQFTREQNGIVHEYADFKLSSQELD